MPPISKPESRKRVKARTARQHAAARKACVDAVWKRDDSTCQLCGSFVRRPTVTDFPPEWGHVDEIIPRSLGGSDTDLENLRLVCHLCHFSGPSGAHRKTVRRAPEIR